MLLNYPAREYPAMQCMPSEYPTMEYLAMHAIRIIFAHCLLTHTHIKLEAVDVSAGSLWCILHRLCVPGLA